MQRRSLLSRRHRNRVTTTGLRAVEGRDRSISSQGRFIGRNWPRSREIIESETASATYFSLSNLVPFVLETSLLRGIPFTAGSKASEPLWGKEKSAERKTGNPGGRRNNGDRNIRAPWKRGAWHPLCAMRSFPTNGSTAREARYSRRIAVDLFHGIDSLFEKRGK